MHVYWILRKVRAGDFFKISIFWTKVILYVWQGLSDLKGWIFLNVTFRWSKQRGRINCVLVPFVKGFASIALVDGVWTVVKRSKTLKTALTSAPILGYPHGSYLIVTLVMTEWEQPCPKYKTALKEWCFIETPLFFKWMQFLLQGGTPIWKFIHHDRK